MMKRQDIEMHSLKMKIRAHFRRGEIEDFFDYFYDENIERRRIHELRSTFGEDKKEIINYATEHLVGCLECNKLYRNEVRRRALNDARIMEKNGGGSVKDNLAYFLKGADCLQILTTKQ